MDLYQKYSITPLSLNAVSEGELGLPISLGDISVESIAGLLKPEHFSLWKDYLSRQLVDSFKDARVALVHRFQSGFTSGKEEEDSKELLHHAFMCLRLVKPTRRRFSAVHYRRTKDQAVDVSGIVYPASEWPINLPESEILNEVSRQDLMQFRSLWPIFRNVELFSSHLRRAIRYYETGYEALRDADIQFTTWVTGIESLYAEADEPCPVAELKQRILRSIGPRTDIYRELQGEEKRSFYAPTPTLLVKDIIDEMFQLRNRFIHGVWAPQPWLEKTMRKSLSSRPLTLPDVLREAASFILRTGIKNTLLSNGA